MSPYRQAVARRLASRHSRPERISDRCALLWRSPYYCRLDSLQFIAQSLAASPPCRLSSLRFVASPRLFRVFLTGAVVDMMKRPQSLCCIIKFVLLVSGSLTPHGFNIMKGLGVTLCTRCKAICQISLPCCQHSGFSFGPPRWECGAIARKRQAHPTAHLHLIHSLYHHREALLEIVAHR